MPETRPVLQQMTVADTIDTAIGLYRHNFVTILGICAVVRIPSLAMGLYAQYTVMQVLVNAEDIDALLSLSQAPLAIVAIASVLVGALLYPLGEAALVIAVSRIYLGRDATVSGAYSRAMKYWLPILWTTLLFYAVAALTFVGGLFIIGTILMIGAILRYLFAPAVIVVLEKRSGWAAMARSWALTAGYFWHVFAVMTVLYLLVVIVTSSIAMPAQFGQMFFAENQQVFGTVQIVAQALVSAISLLVYPLWMIGAVLLYYDVRIRKEGFDLMMMARRLDETAAETAARGRRTHQTDAHPPDGNH